jgi:hypothetical protein
MIPPRYLRLTGLLSQPRTAVYPYRAAEVVSVDTRGRPWLNPAAEPYQAVTLGDRTEKRVPYVYIELTSDARWILILPKAALTIGEGKDQKCYQWQTQACIPPGWLLVDEVREVES